MNRIIPFWACNWACDAILSSWCHCFAMWSWFPCRDRLGCFNLSHRDTPVASNSSKVQCSFDDFGWRWRHHQKCCQGLGIRNCHLCWPSNRRRNPFNDYFEYYGPDYGISVPSNNMVNLNTPEYLEKCKQKIIENLRHCQFAPSVQLQDVPRDMFLCFILIRRFRWLR